MAKRNVWSEDMIGPAFNAAAGSRFAERLAERLANAFRRLNGTTGGQPAAGRGQVSFHDLFGASHRVIQAGAGFLPGAGPAGDLMGRMGDVLAALDRWQQSWHAWKQGPAGATHPTSASGAAGAHGTQPVGQPAPAGSVTAPPTLRTFPAVPPGWDWRGTQLARLPDPSPRQRSQSPGTADEELPKRLRRDIRPSPGMELATRTGGLFDALGTVLPGFAGMGQAVSKTVRIVQAFRDWQQAREGYRGGQAMAKLPEGFREKWGGRELPRFSTLPAAGIGGQSRPAAATPGEAPPGSARPGTVPAPASIPVALPAETPAAVQPVPMPAILDALPANTQSPATPSPAPAPTPAPLPIRPPEPSRLPVMPATVTPAPTAIPPATAPEPATEPAASAITPAPKAVSPLLGGNAAPAPVPPVPQPRFREGPGRLPAGLEAPAVPPIRPEGVSRLPLPPSPSSTPSTPSTLPTPAPAKKDRPLAAAFEAMKALGGKPTPEIMQRFRQVVDQVGGAGAAALNEALVREFGPAPKAVSPLLGGNAAPAPVPPVPQPRFREGPGESQTPVPAAIPLGTAPAARPVSSLLGGQGGMTTASPPPTAVPGAGSAFRPGAQPEPLRLPDVRRKLDESTGERTPAELTELPGVNPALPTPQPPRSSPLPAVESEADDLAAIRAGADRNAEQLKEAESLFRRLQERMAADASPIVPAPQAGSAVAEPARLPEGKERSARMGPAFERGAAPPPPPAGLPMLSVRRRGEPEGVPGAARATADPLAVPGAADPLAAPAGPVLSGSGSDPLARAAGGALLGGGLPTGGGSAPGSSLLGGGAGSLSGSDLHEAARELKEAAGAMVEAAKGMGQGHPGGKPSQGAPHAAPEQPFIKQQITPPFAGRGGAGGEVDGQDKNIEFGRMLSAFAGMAVRAAAAGS